MSNLYDDSEATIELSVAEYEHIVKMLEDHEKRIKDLERRLIGT